MLHGINGGTTTVSLKAPKSVTADTYGTVIDLMDYKGQAIITVNPGVATSDSLGDASLVVKVMTGDSSGGGDATDTIVTFTAMDSKAVCTSKSLDLTACDRYIRLHFNISATTATFLVSAEGTFDNAGY